MSDKPLSPRMENAIEHMIRNNNKLVRFPGGYWAREGWHSWNGPCWGTPTIEALVKRGFAEYTVWKDGRGGKFPIEVSLNKEKMWRRAYGQRLYEQGYTGQEAYESAQAAEYLPDVDPIESADDEVSYRRD